MKCATLSALVAVSLMSTASAEQFVYPAKGQSPDLQRKDEAECYAWAVQHTGFDPANPQRVAAAPAPTTPTGVTPGAGVRGAAGGAVVGAITGDAGKGAATGAIAGRVISRARNKARTQSAEQQQQAQLQQQQESFGRARAACLEGRGYSLK
jgi:hypothetical protein